MTYDEVPRYCLGKPGGWQDEPWEGNVVVKVAARIFALLGQPLTTSTGRSDWLSTL